MRLKASIHALRARTRVPRKLTAAALENAGKRHQSLHMGRLVSREGGAYARRTARTSEWETKGCALRHVLLRTRQPKRSPRLDRTVQRGAPEVSPPSRRLQSEWPSRTQRRRRAPGCPPTLSSGPLQDWGRARQASEANCGSMLPAPFYPGSFQYVKRDPARGCIPGPYVVVVVVAAGVASTGAQSDRSA